MNKELTITISGTAGSGKSTMAEAVTDLLAAAGFDVEHIPMEDLSHSTFSKNKKNRQMFLKEHATVTVREMQAPRASHKD